MCPDAPAQLSGRGGLAGRTDLCPDTPDQLTGRGGLTGRTKVFPDAPDQLTVKCQKTMEKYESDEEDDSESDEWETDDETNEIHSDQVGYIGNPVKEDYKKLYEMKMAENIKLTAELKKYMTALKEETVKRSKAADMVNILRITKDSESEMDKLMNTLTIQES